MLRHLSIINYALIDRVEVDISAGFTAITGETGSGKSILLDALGLALGERADSKTIRDGQQKCVVEAVFSLEGYGLEAYFADHDIDYEPRNTFRREIAASGKSRSFINDTPVPLNVLRELGNQLVDIHSQHENTLIGTRAFQLDSVDAFASNTTERTGCAAAYRLWKAAGSQLADLLAQEQKLRQDLDYYRFQHEELFAAGLEKLDEVQLAAELETLSHAETINDALRRAIAAVSAEEGAALDGVTAAKNAIARSARHHSALEAMVVRLESARIELADIAAECEELATKVVFDPGRMEEINNQLARLQHLLKKHNCRDTVQLIALRDELAARISTAENLDQHIAAARATVERSEKELTGACGRLSETRRSAAARLEAEVKANFRALALDHATLQVEVKPSAAYTSDGADDVTFLFSANKGSALLPLRQVASGGEMSRVMLALKAAVSQYRRLPTLILDEIDQGISGETALRVAEMMRKMSGSMQLVCITHLPQIAGKATHHLKIYKTTHATGTSTCLESLDEDGRVKELAGMMSGNTRSAASMESARELLEH